MNPEDPIDRIKFQLGSLLVELEARAAQIVKLEKANAELSAQLKQAREQAGFAQLDMEHRNYQQQSVNGGAGQKVNDGQ